MTNKRTYIYLIIIMVVFAVVMFLVFAKPRLETENKSAVFIVGDNTVWKYDNNKWLNVTIKSSKKKLDWQTFNVYSNNKYIGDYLLLYDDKWYVFSKKKKAINLDGELLAYQANYNINILKFNSLNISADDYVYQVLSNNNIGLSSRFTTLSKTTIDFDGDGETEDFYLVSNAFSSDFNPEYVFSFVFMVKDGKIYEIYNDVSKNEFYNGCKPYFKSFLDVNDDGIYEFILSCGKYSSEGVTDMLYNYSKDGFKILISNQ